MKLADRIFGASRAELRSLRKPRQLKKRLAIGASAGVFALLAIMAIAPPTPNPALPESTVSGRVQSLRAADDLTAATAKRDAYASSPGVKTLAASGTNYDWARLVMQSGGWPMSDNNITVMVRWMRQENGTASWWNRNNPMNNGYGSGGGGGLGSYQNLVIAAQMAAANLHQNKSFSAIVAGFASSAPTAVTEAAIWASPWASSHYGNGTRWHYTPVDEVKAPASAW
jgi:hypothetical protein